MKKYYILLSLMLFSATVTAFAQDADSVAVSVTALPSTMQSKAYYSFSEDSSIFENQPQSDVAKSLYGELPGVLVQGVNGPSSTNLATFSIHGKVPLVLVDGFPRELSELYNLEVASITVLKDAASLAIYGVQGANGVILVTTKRGSISKLNVGVNYQFGVTTPFREPEMADSYTYATMLNQALANDGLSAKYNDMELAAFRNGTHSLLFPNVDWMDEVYNNFSTNHKLNIQFDGGNEKFRYYTMVDYNLDNALYKSNSTDSRYSVKPTDTRLGLRTNIDVDFSESTHLNLGVMARIAEVNNSANATLASNAAFNTPSGVFPIRNSEGVYGSATGYGDQNPVALLLDSGSEKITTSTLLANLSLTQDLDFITKGLKVDVSVGFDYLGAMYDNVYKTYRYSEYNASILEDGTVVTYPFYNGENSSSLTYEDGFTSIGLRADVRAKIDYSRTFGKHGLDAFLLYRQYSLNQDGQNESAKRQGFTAMASYNFDNRILVDGVVGYSGTSFLEEGSRFTTYPAVSASWVLSNERFMRYARNVNSLRLFSSFGYSGSDRNLSHDLYKQYYGGTNANSYYFTTGYTLWYGQAEGDLPVENLAPELSRRFTAGIEASMFDNRLSLYAEYFNDHRSNILITSEKVSGILGIDVTYLCEGVNKYQGVDFAAKWSDKVGDWRYSADFNGSYYRSRIVENGEGYKTSDYLYKVGNQVGQLYGLEVIGIFESYDQIYNSPTQSFSSVAPGDLIYKDQNGDGVINSEDIVAMYDTSNPKFVFGAGFNVAYKRLSLGIELQGVTGVTKSLLDTGLYNPLVLYGNISNTYLERETLWTASTINTATVPRLTTISNDNNYRNNSLWLKDFSYLKLRNIVLGYDVPLKNERFPDLHVYVQATDVFSIDSIGFTDPETLSSEDYVSTRGFWAGVKFNF
ncbi:MAG: SusC/RagA family TonB-linked outer membrane protein [Rikenellaceae bacterium]